MTYNVQHCLNFMTQKINFDAVADEIRKSGADIVGLNEIRGADLRGYNPEFEAQASILGAKLGYYPIFAPAFLFEGGHCPYGNAFLSRFPILKTEVVPVPDPAVRKYDGYYETRCLLKAVLDINGKALTVCVIHFGLNPDEHENAVNTVTAQIKSTSCVLMGDFNVTPEDPLLAPIRETMTDTADITSDALLTYPSDAPDRKIDYIFVGKDMKVTSVCVPDTKVSDHRPLVTEVEW